MNNFSSVAELNQFAANFSDTLDKVNDYILQNQWALPVAGAVGGAGLGAIGGLALGDKKKSKLRRAIEGGLIGTGIGGLGGLAAGQTYANQYKNKVLETLIKEGEELNRAKIAKDMDCPLTAKSIVSDVANRAESLGLVEKDPLALDHRGNPLKGIDAYKSGFKKDAVLKYMSNILNRKFGPEDLERLGGEKFFY